MMRIPGRGRLNKSINVHRATSVRASFIEKIEKADLRIIEGEPIPVQLVSFSSGSTYYDQLLSILSFTKYVGIPSKWIIFSDGTYKEKDLEKLMEFSFVEVIKDYSDRLPGLLNVNNASWQEKKFFYFASIKVTGTTIFLDSDILFFPGFSNNMLNAIKDKNWYLPYFEPQFDAYFLQQENDYYHKMNYTNSGFFILNKNIDWENGKRYLTGLRENNIGLTHFSEQTAMEIVFKTNQLRFLDSKRFCLSMEDHFTLGSGVDYSALAIRHFVGPIRFRMWLCAQKFDFFL